MNDENRQLLNDEIHDELEELSDLEFGSESYKVAVDGLSKLMDRSIELQKIEIEVEEKENNRRHEEYLKLQQQINDRTDRLISHGINIAGIVIPTIVTIWGTYKTLKFEEHGTVTTMMGRGFINKLLPKSKF